MTPEPHRPYVSPDASPTELTVRSLVLGAVLGTLFAASSVYLAVRVGLTVSASIPIAVMSIAVFRAFGRSPILENTIVQTTGSAGESLAFGIAAALPALLFLGYDIDLVHAFLIAALGGVLGVLMMIPLRHGLIVEEHGKLTYPEGTACADVLIAGDRGGTTARTVVSGFIAGGIYKLAYAALHLWKEVVSLPLSWTEKAADGTSRQVGFLGATVSAEVSPELLGVGYIIGPRIAGIQFAGGVLSYLVLIPAIRFFGAGLDQPLFSPTGLLIRDMAPDQIRNHYVLYVGAGAVATGGLISLLRSLPTIVGAFRRSLGSFTGRQTTTPQVPRTERDMPMSVVLVGSALLLLAIWLAPPLSVNFLSALLILCFGFFFVTVSARITGEIGSSSNPISGMVVATLLVTCLVYLLLGWTTPQDRFAALTTAAIVGVAASNGGTTAQDLKTAYLVGGTPYRQQIALFVGVITSAVFLGGTLVVLNKGATVIVPFPERDRGLEETLHDVAAQPNFSQIQAPFVIDRAALKKLGLDEQGLARALWARGYELEAQKQELRSFAHPDPADLKSLTIRAGDRDISVQSFAQLGPPTVAAYRSGFIRGHGPIPPGKYLVGAGGQIEYLIDPGIGGRITEHLGQKLTRYDAPKARLFSLIIDGILTRQLPWNLVLLGVFLSLMLELCGVASLPFAVGVYLPISTSAPIFVGGAVRHWINRRNAGSESDFSPGTLLSSGYIAGGAIAGVAIAMLALPGGGAWLEVLDVDVWLPRVVPLAWRTAPETLWNQVAGFLPEETRQGLPSGIWALTCFACLVLYLLATASRRESPSGGPEK